MRIQLIEHRSSECSDTPDDEKIIKEEYYPRTELKNMSREISTDLELITKEHSINTVVVWQNGVKVVHRELEHSVNTAQARSLTVQLRDFKKELIDNE